MAPNDEDRRSHNRRSSSSRHRSRTLSSISPNARARNPTRGPSPSPLNPAHTPLNRAISPTTIDRPRPPLNPLDLMRPNPFLLPPLTSISISITRSTSLSYTIPPSTISPSTDHRCPIHRGLPRDRTYPCDTRRGPEPACRTHNRHALAYISPHRRHPSDYRTTDNYPTEVGGANRLQNFQRELDREREARHERQRRDDRLLAEMEALRFDHRGVPRGAAGPDRERSTRNEGFGPFSTPLGRRHHRDLVVEWEVEEISDSEGVNEGKTREAKERTGRKGENSTAKEKKDRAEKKEKDKRKPGRPSDRRGTDPSWMHRNGRRDDNDDDDNRGAGGIKPFPAAAVAGTGKKVRLDDM